MDAMKSSANKVFLFTERVNVDSVAVSMGGSDREILGMLTVLNECATRLLMEHGVKASNAVALLQVAAEEGTRRALKRRGRNARCQ